MPIQTFPFRLLYRGTSVSNHTLTGVTVSEFGFTNSGGAGDDMISRESNPDWRIQVSKHVDASTAYSRSSTALLSISPAKCHALTDPSWVPSLGYSYDVTNIVVDYSNLFFGPDSDFDLREEARSKLVRKLREQLSQAQALAPIAECRDLYRLVRTATGFCYETLLSIKGLTRLRTRRARRQIQNLWLTWNFGIAPLVRDISSIGKAISDHLARDDRTFRLYGSAKRTLRGSYSPPFSSANSIAPIGCEAGGKWGTYQTDISYLFVGSRRINFSASEDYNLLSAVGIDLRSVPSALWEVTAFSWIADYFGNIGTYLEDVFYSPPGDLIYLNEIKKVKAQLSLGFDYRVIEGNPNKMLMVSSQPMVATLQRQTFNRAVLGTLPTPSITVKSFDKVASYEVSKLLNLVALMR